MEKTTRCILDIESWVAKPIVKEKVNLLANKMAQVELIKGIVKWALEGCVETAW